MYKEPQIITVKRRLKEYGYCSRNWALDHRPNITRLASIIGVLERQGWGFDAQKDGSDYVYTLKYKPE